MKLKFRGKKYSLTTIPLLLVVFAAILSVANIVPVMAQQIVQQTDVIHTINSEVHIKLVCISVIFFTYCW